jgi:hypothetical protein
MQRSMLSNLLYDHCVRIHYFSLGWLAGNVLIMLLARQCIYKNEKLCKDKLDTKVHHVVRTKDVGGTVV